MNQISQWASNARKFLAAAAAVIAQVLALGLLHGDALRYTQLIAGIIGAALVYGVANQPALADVDDTGPGSIDVSHPSPGPGA
jgi:hypothetical protein